MSRIPYTLMLCKRGVSHREIAELHEKYGDAVRVSPDQVLFRHPEAWKETIGHLKGGKEEHGKSPIFAAPVANSIFGASREKHAEIRRTLAHGFSSASLTAQGKLIYGYIDQLFQQLHARSSSGPIDVVTWYNMLTFDIIGDLAFGEAFGQLKSGKTHPWVDVTFESIFTAATLSEVRLLTRVNASFPSSLGAVANSIIVLKLANYTIPSPLLFFLLPSGFLSKRKEQLQYTELLVKKRLALTEPRPDFIESMLKKPVRKLSYEEIFDNVQGLSIAG